MGGDVRDGGEGGERGRGGTARAPARAAVCSSSRSRRAGSARTGGTRPGTAQQRRSHTRHTRSPVSHTPAISPISHPMRVRTRAPHYVHAHTPSFLPVVMLTEPIFAGVIGLLALLNCVRARAQMSEEEISDADEQCYDLTWKRGRTIS